jgi:hypothetical protein
MKLDLELEKKKRFMRDSLHISPKDLSTKEINSFFKDMETIKRKYKK